MKINATWHSPLVLVDGNFKRLVYWTNTEILPKEEGCYLFCNKHGNNIKILYVGQAKNLRSRVEQHFKKNVMLMRELNEYGNGTRILLYCTIKSKKADLLNLLETQLIRTALEKGHELLNVHGARRRKSEINFDVNNRDSLSIFGRKMEFYL